MFEKEAQYYAFDEVKHKQEWYIKHPERSIDEDYEDIKKHWGKGAEHGYYKAKVEVEDSYRESLCNSELNLASVTEQLEELEKANKWHYVKDGLFPKEGETVICFCRGYCGASFCATAQLYIGYDDKVRRWWTNAGEGKSEQLIDVIAWKEIVFPKED